MVNRSLFKATPSSQVFGIQHFMLLVFSLLSIVFVLTNCSKDTCNIEQTYIEYLPVYSTLEEIRQPIKALPPKFRENTGKILFYKDYILMNEPHIGIHVINNSNPSNPTEIAFYDIPGNVEMAMDGDILIADHYLDLVRLDISNIQAPVTVDRIENAITDVYEVVADKGIIVDWEPKLLTKKGSCDSILKNVYHHPYEIWCGVGSLPGISSIYYPNLGQPQYFDKRIYFTRNDEHLYLVEKKTLSTFSINNEFSKVNETELDARFDYSPVGSILNVWDDYLFLGKNNGQVVFNISSPESPASMSEIEGFSYCNKVLFDENRAYVINSSEQFCFNSTSRLDVLSFENEPNPLVERTFLMINPTGVACTEEALFVADAGIKIFDKSNPIDLEFVDTHFTNFSISNIYKIPNEMILLAETPLELVQFDISNPQGLKEISRILK